MGPPGQQMATLPVLDDFVVRAALASVGIALVAAPLGCFVVWRRMAYFGDTSAHAALLGVVLALAFSLPITPSVIAVSLVMAIAVTYGSGKLAASDTMLGVASHAAVAFGLVLAALLVDVRIDLLSLLFGDILAVSKTDLAIIGTIVVGELLLFAWCWPRLLTSTLNPELAHASGIAPTQTHLVLTLALAFLVAIALEVVGALLIVAMLIIPPAAARPLSRTPEQMVAITALLGVCSAMGGLAFSLVVDVPTGPAMVCTATCLFLASRIGAAVRT